jgi:hypothetical protein
MPGVCTTRNVLQNDSLHSRRTGISGAEIRDFGPYEEQIYALKLRSRYNAASRTFQFPDVTGQQVADACHDLD